MTISTDMWLLRMTDPAVLIIDRKDWDLFEKHTNKYITPFNTVRYSTNYIELDKRAFPNATSFAKSWIAFTPENNQLLFHGLNKHFITEFKVGEKLPNLKNWFYKQRNLYRQSELLKLL